MTTNTNAIISTINNMVSDNGSAFFGNTNSSPSLAKPLQDSIAELANSNDLTYSPLLNSALAFWINSSNSEQDGFLLNKSSTNANCSSAFFLLAMYFGIT